MAHGLLVQFQVLPENVLPPRVPSTIRQRPGRRVVA